MKKQNYLLAAIVWAILATGTCGCRKNDLAHQNSPEVNSTKSIARAGEHNFFYDGELPKPVAVMMELVRAQNEEYQFVGRLTETAGLPVWEHAQVIAANPGEETADNAIVLVPIVPLEASYVSAFMVGVVNGGTVTSIKLFNGNHYGAYGWGGTEPLNAERVLMQIMEFDHQLFGKAYFTVTDKRLFNLENLTDVAAPVIKVEPAPLVMDPRKPCYKVVLVDLDGNPVNDTNPLLNDCEEIWITITGAPGWGGGGSGSGGGGGNGGGSGGGSGGSGDGDWFNQPCMENPPSVPPPPGYSYPPACTDVQPVIPFLPSLHFTVLTSSFEPDAAIENDDPELAYWKDDTPFDIQVEEQAKPTFSAMYNAYPFSYLTPGAPGIEMPVDALCTLIGGEVKTEYDKGNVKNGCALRLSRALNYAGINIPVVPDKTWKGSDGKNYFFRAEHLYKFLTKTFKAADVHLTETDGGTDGSGFAAKLSGKQGIYLMLPKDPGSFQASGHATLYNQIDCLGGHNYFVAAKEIFLWTLK